MKKQSTDLVISINREDLLNLTKEVREVSAADMVKSRKGVFSSTDLWNIQRQTRARRERRHLR